MAKKLNSNAEFQQSKNEKMFALIKNKNGKVVICLGGFMVSSKKFDNYEQADKYIGTKPWELLINCIYVVIKQNEENEKIKELSKETKEDA